MAWWLAPLLVWRDAVYVAWLRHLYDIGFYRYRWRVEPSTQDEHDDPMGACWPTCLSFGWHSWL
jgi:hypothetical protein